MRVPREMEIYRRDESFGYPRGDHGNGCFFIPNRGLRIIVSNGEGWDHVSVSLEDRCPTWEEMQWVREKFFGDDETAMQIHPPLSDHVNHHPYCLHLWRPQNHDIPLPPKWLIA